jgi:hypothetical protein
MTGGGVSDNDMPIFPWSSPGDVPPVGDPAFDALLAGHLRAEDTAEGLRPAAEAIAALNAAAAGSELAAEASARAVFRAAGQPGQPVRSRRSSRGRRPLVTALRSARLAVAAAAAVTLGGTAAAAYAGALPAAAQKVAHDILGAPAHRGAYPARPSAPVARTAHSGIAPAVTSPDHSTGQPSSHPTVEPPGHSAGKPSTHRTGKPSTHPTSGPPGHSTGGPPGHSTGKPANHPDAKTTTSP